MEVLIVFLITFSVLARCSSQPSNDTNSTGCVELVTGPGHQQVFEGWPHLVSCDLFRYTENFTLFDMDFGARIECTISNEIGKVVFNQSTSVYDLAIGLVKNFGYSINNVFSSSFLNYTITITDLGRRNCYSTKISLNVSQLARESCQEFLRRSNPATLPQRIGSFEVSRLRCQVGHDEFPKIDQNENVTYRWQHNCDSNSLSTKQTMTIRWNSFDQIGSYVCSASFNGMTRYVTARKYCITKSLTIGTPPSLTCTDLEVLRNEGRDAQFLCFANFGEGRLGPENFDIFWKRHNESSESEPCFSQSGTKSRDHQCLYDNPNNVCYEQVPTEEEIKRDAIVTIRLRINNIRRTDYGSYMIMVTKDKKLSSNITLTLAPNPIPVLRSTETVIGICIGATLIFIVVILILIYNAVYIRVYWKRYFGVYIIDDRLYGATLAYNFSQENDIFSQQDLKSSVMHVRDLLEQTGYRVYDERRDGWFESDQSENIAASIASCHRLVIFLSLEFIKDGWSMLALQKGFEEMINSRSRLIFILLPGIKEYLKQHSRDDDSCRLIQRAIKLNYAIQWSEKILKKKRFLVQLEDAMPKLTSSPSDKVVQSVRASNGVSTKKSTLPSHSENGLEINRVMV